MIPSLTNFLSIFASNVIWHGAIRFLLFWSLVAIALFVLGSVTPYSNWQLVFAVFKDVREGELAQITDQTFAFALASGIVQFGAALGFAFLIAHVLLIRAALSAAKQVLGPGGDYKAFAKNFDSVSQTVRRNAIVGHAWRAFTESLVRKDDVVRNTVRPQAFINLAHARERLFGLKMMASIPGFFVGLGLLLTFIGLVLALNKTAGSTTAGSAEAMTHSLNDLLNAATFKFSTSIAGLGVSLGLSLAFRTYQIWIEGAFESFGRALEDRLRFQPPQRIAADSLESLEAQHDQLREINSETFFARLGESIAPRFHSISTSLDRTVEELKQTSHSGVDTLVKSFVDRLDHGAGRELSQVVETLAGLRDGLEGIRTSLAGSGQDVSDKLAAAAENLSRVVADAGTALGHSATGVAGKVESVMESIAGKLEAQTARFGEQMAGLQRAVAARMEESGRIASEAGAAAVDASKRAVDKAADDTQAAVGAMRKAMEEVTQDLSAHIARLSSALQSAENAFSAQTRHIDGITTRSRETADAFGHVAANVRSTTQPLLASSKRVAESADTMAKSIAISVNALATTQSTASGIAEQLDAHLKQIANLWNQYEARFKGVDEDLERAAGRFHEEVSRHHEAMRNFVVEVDRHTGAILSSISGAVNDLDTSIQDLSDTLGPFVRMKGREAAE